MLAIVLRNRFRPRKWLAQVRADLERRMQVVLFISFFTAEIAASVAFYRIAPGNPICIWYANVWSYGTGHLIMSFLVVLAIAAAWWFIGNPAFWGAICRTRQRGRVLLQAGLAGLGIDLASNLLARSYISSFNDGMHFGAQSSIAPWLLLRAALWATAYVAAGVGFLWILHLDLKSRRLTDVSPK